MVASDVPVYLRLAHRRYDQLQVPKKGVIARVIRLVIAFSIGGAIHAAGSYTMLGDTKPLNSFLFFFL